MKHALSPAAKKDLRRFLATRPAFFTDFDGTLVPIAEKPHLVCFRPSTLRHLETILQRFPNALITGRARGDVLRRLQGTRFDYVVGNHGLEWPGNSASSRRYLRLVSRWKRALVEKLGPEPGIEIEDKKYSLTIHYRRAPRDREAKRVIRSATRGLIGAKVMGGKKVVNVVPEGAPDKAVAFASLLKKVRRKSALYLGDCATDENVFRRHRPPRAFTVRIGHSRSSRAAYYLRRQSELDQFLEEILSALS